MPGLHEAMFEAIRVKIPGAASSTSGNHFNLTVTPRKDAWIQVLPKDGRLWVGLAIDSNKRHENLFAASYYRNQFAKEFQAIGIKEWSLTNNTYMMRDAGSLENSIRDLVDEVERTNKVLMSLLDNEEPFES